MTSYPTWNQLTALDWVLTQLTKQKETSNA